MISYIGGKARIGKWIVPFIPRDIETYVEPFSGMFWVFFNMDLERYPNLSLRFLARARIPSGTEMVGGSELHLKLGFPKLL